VKKEFRLCVEALFFCSEKPRGRKNASFGARSADVCGAFGRFRRRSPRRTLFEKEKKGKIAQSGRFSKKKKDETDSGAPRDRRRDVRQTLRSIQK